MDIAERFAANLVRLRRAAGLTQEELANLAAVHRTQVGLAEAGRRLPRLDTLVKLAGSLEVTPNDLTEGIAWDPAVQSAGSLRISEPK